MDDSTWELADWRTDLALAGFALLVLAALSQPGLLVGAALAAGWSAWRSPRWPARIGIAAAGIGAAWVVGANLVLGWTWRILLVSSFRASAPVAPSAVLASLLTEALAGPAWLLGMALWGREEARLPRKQVEAERRRQEQRRARMQRDVGALPFSEASAEEQHPVATIRLGVDDRRQPFDLSLPADVGQHVTVLGRIGTGKTTTAGRLIEGVVEDGWPVVIVDAKGFGSLRRTADLLSRRSGRPLKVVAPDDPESLAYNPCTGGPPQITNKLVGAFTFSGSAEVYKQIAQETLSVLVAARQLTGEPVTLAWLHRALDTGRMAGGIAASVRDLDPDLAQTLVDFAKRGNLYTTAYAGMAARLGSLLRGAYGPLLNAAADAPQLDVQEALDEPGITYISLPAMGSSEDVELMARVLAQDLKQAAFRRLQRGDPTPALLVLDEFAALREAEQLNDLLLQAREARVACVVCTQFLPDAAENSGLRHALLSAGLFITHQCSPADAEDVAGLFGTRRGFEVTNQIDYETGYSQKGSVRNVRDFRVHPDDLKDLPRGVAAIRAEPGRRRIAIVHVQPVTGS